MRRLTLLLTLSCLLGCNWMAFLPDNNHAPQSSGAVGTLTGMVIENNHGCTVDAACSFTLETDDGMTYDVIYHYGEFPPCTNTAPFDLSFSLQPGDRVAVTAAVQSATTLPLCDSIRYTVTRLDE